MNDKEKLKAIYDITAGHAWDKIHTAHAVVDGYAEGGTKELSIALDDLITSWDKIVKITRED